MDASSRAALGATGKKAAGGARSMRIDFTGARSKEAMLQVVAKTLKFPRHFGMNLDALHDCLTDRKLPGGTAIVLVKLAHTPAGDAVHGVFRAALRIWNQQAGAAAGAKVSLARE